VRFMKEPQCRLHYSGYDEEMRLLKHCTEPPTSLLIIEINTGVDAESEALILKGRTSICAASRATGVCQERQDADDSLDSGAVAHSNMCEGAHGESVFADAAIRAPCGGTQGAGR